MAKRVKRLEKGVDSLKDGIEEHFSKLEKDIREGRTERGKYHVKEIDKSLLKALEIKIDILGVNDDSVKKFRERLDNLKKKLGG